MNISVEQATVTMKSLYGWHIKSLGQVNCYLAGHGENYEKIISQVLHDNDHQKKSVLLRNEKNFFSYVISSPDFIFACVDRIKSYPLFYGFDQYHHLFVSNCPYRVKEAAHLTRINLNAMLEYSMASYVLGENTLYESLYQLQAGECLLWLREKKTVVMHRYYRYVPNPDNNINITTLKDEQSDVMDRVMERTITKAKGRPIWVPLSGGLDSRIIVAKLVEKKYDHIQTFSYGLPGNFEAQKAKRVAQQLNVPWFFVSAQPRQAKKLYRDPKTQAYAQFTSACHTVPGYMEYEALMTLRKKQLIPDNAVIINGQSGDFVTGGHLPREVFYKPGVSVDDFFSALIKKHGSCWHPLLTHDNLAYLKQTIMTALPKTEDHLSLRDRLLAQYESWEWQERQCKAVIKGQRLYDWLALDWDLPLWDPELMDFWQKVPFEWKIEQKLYINYLQEYNYKNVFSEMRCPAKPWVRKFSWIPVVAQLIGLLFGKEMKTAYYQRMYYYATDYYQYALIGRKYYLKHYKNARGLGPFLLSHYLDSLGIIAQSKIAHTKP